MLVSDTGGVGSFLEIAWDFEVEKIAFEQVIFRTLRDSKRLLLFLILLVLHSRLYIIRG